MIKTYLKLAFKILLRRKFFTFVSLFAVSFTLVVLMVVTAMFDHVFGAMPPETRNDRTLGVYYAKLSGPGGTSDGAPGYEFLDRYVRTLPQAEKLSISSTINRTTIFHRGEPVPSWLKYTDGAFWEILEFKFLEGGPFTATDDKNGSLVAVINDATRRRLFGEGSALGQSLEVDGRRFNIVGVVANVPFLRFLPFADVWIPNGTAKIQSRELTGNYVGMILARRADDLPAIKAEFKSLLTQVEFKDPRAFNRLDSAAETFFEFTSRMLSSNRDESQPNRLLAGLFIGAILFMLLPTINLININASRIMERAGEIGVRKAFGASSWTLVGQFIIENILLTLIGGVIGFALSRLVLRAITESNLIPYADFQLNHRIFIYGLLTAIFFGLFSGVYPAWKMSRLHPVKALKGAAR